MEKVADLEVYVQRMQKSFMDKMFFIDKIFEPIDTILDFGCANGVLIRAMQYLFPEYAYMGYDISEDMIQKAQELLPECRFYKEWDEIAMDPKETLINISSTLHEVYSYGTEASVAEFWDRVFGSGFKYIAIRDMMAKHYLSGTIRLVEAVFIAGAIGTGVATVYYLFINWNVIIIKINLKQKY